MSYGSTLRCLESVMILPEVARGARHLELKTRRLLGAWRSGFFASRFRGAGLAFETIRPYEPGDDVRNIDWKVTAKSGKPYVKIFNEERERVMWLLVDRSPSMDLANGLTSKAQAATEAAALFALHAQNMQDRIGLICHGGGEDHWLTPAHGRAHLRRLLATLVTPIHHHDSKSMTTDEEMVRLLKRQRAKGMMVFISDFLDESLNQKMLRLTSKHHVLAVRIVDPWEKELPNLGLVSFSDAETGQRTLIDTGSFSVRTAFAKQTKERALDLRRRFTAKGVRLVTAVTDKPIVQNLVRQLAHTD